LSFLSNNFGICSSSVFRWVKLDEHYSDLSPKPHAGHREHKIRDDELEKLKSLVQEKPDRTVKELAHEWNARYSTSVGNAVMGRALLRAGLPFKKKLFVR
jgi:transposase